MTAKKKMPTTWKVPDGWVLTWYPPFTFPYAVDPNQMILVYDEDEPFVPAVGGAGDGGFNPNVSEASLSDFDGEHPGVYALNVQGDEPKADDIHPDAIQVYGKKV